MFLGLLHDHDMGSDYLALCASLGTKGWGVSTFLRLFRDHDMGYDYLA